jgi:KaiC/GvpD/RAD55 family RecA-like ATPase
VVCVAQVKAQKQSWLWPCRIPEGDVLYLEGIKGTGKSTMAAAIAADVTGGPPLPGNRRRRSPGNVLWFTIEESRSRKTKPKLEAAGADLNRVYFPGCDRSGQIVQQLQLPRDLATLESLIRAGGVKLVVFDSIASFVVGVKLSDPQEGRQFMESLEQVAERTGCTFLLIRHFIKGRADKALDQGFGSAECGNVARAVLQIRYHPDDPSLRVLTVAACNDGEVPPSLRFKLVDKGGVQGVEWHGQEGLTAEQLAEAQGKPGERDARGDAREFLKLHLEVGDRAAKDMEKQANESGIRPSTLREAKKELGVTSHPIGPNNARYFVWRKPKGGWPKGEA